MLIKVYLSLFLQKVMCSTAVMYGDALARYGFGDSHPMGSDRLYAFWSKFCMEELDKVQNVMIEEPVMTNEDTLLNFHSKTYIEFVKKASIFGKVAQHILANKLKNNTDFQSRMLIFSQINESDL